MQKRKQKNDLTVKNPISSASVKKKVRVTDAEPRSVPAPMINETVPGAPERAAIDPSVNCSSESLEEPQFNLFVGTEHGILKGIGFGGELPISKTLYKDRVLTQKAPAVVHLTWVRHEESQDEKELLVTFSNHVVKTYSSKLRCFTRQMEVEIEPEDTKTVGLYSHDSRHYVFGLEDGTLAKWDLLDSKVTFKIQTGKENRHMSKLRQCPADKNIYATGGNENDVKLWNLASENPSEPIFKARNLPHDNLDLRIPVWVQDITFLPRTTEVLGVGTRYGDLRLYDIRTSQRPVSNVKCFDHPVMSISATMNDRQVIIGSAKGEAGLFDLRNPKHERLLMKYVGHSGSIRHVEACKDKPYFVSCGLDRHLYVHKFSNKYHLKKLYMQQQMNCLAISNTFTSAIENFDSSVGSSKSSMNKGAFEGDWANIPPDVLDLHHTPSFKKVDRPRRY